MIQKLILLIGSVFLFLGCQNNEVYSSFCKKNIKRPTCLKIKSLQEETKSFIQKELTELEFKDRCDFTLEAMYYNVKACTNPMANSVGTDFDGYARITLLYKDECYYKVQQDYKGTEWQNSMKAILKHIKDDVLKAQ